MFPKLVESNAIDSLDKYRAGSSEQPNGAYPELFLRECREVKSEGRPSVTLGTDCRLSSAERIGCCT